MRNKILGLAVFFSLGAFAQAVPKPTPMPAKIYTSKPIAITDATRENPVLVLNGKNRFFVNDVKSVSDTLSEKYRHRVLIHTDSIRRYSNSKFTRQVMIIEPK